MPLIILDGMMMSSTPTAVQPFESTTTTSTPSIVSSATPRPPRVHPIHFVRNADGSLSISWDVPQVKLSGASSLLNQVHPQPVVTNSDWPTTLVTDGFNPQSVLHVQFGSNPLHSVGDYRKALSFTKDSAGNITTHAITHKQTIPLADLAGPLAHSGLYVIGYVGVGWNDGLSGNGTLYLNYAYGTTAQNYRPTTPTAVTNASSRIVNGNAVQVSWSHAIAGSAPIAGYRLKWGSSPDGPFPNAVNCSIDAFPIGTTNGYVYTFQASQFPLDGTPFYFLIEAYDDGTAIPANAPVDPLSIAYTPDPISASAVTSLAPITNYGSSKIWFK